MLTNWDQLTSTDQWFLKSSNRWIDSGKAQNEILGHTDNMKLWRKKNIHV